MLKHARERHEREAAALAHAVGAEGREHGGDDDEARDDRHQRIHRTHQRGVAADVLLLGKVGAVSHHDGHTQRQRVERLGQGNEERLWGDLLRVDGQHVAEALARAGQRRRADKEDDQNEEQRRHADLVELLDAALDALDDDERADRHKDKGEEDDRQREEGRARRGVIAEHMIEVAQRVAVDLAGLGGVACDVAQHPAADVGVVAGDDERDRPAHPADPGVALVAELAEGVDDVRLAGAADGELREHRGHADERHDQQVHEQERSAAALKGLAGELPDIAEAHGGAGGSKDEAKLAAPLRAIVFHGDRSLPCFAMFRKKIDTILHELSVFVKSRNII